MLQTDWKLQFDNASRLELFRAGKLVTIWLIEIECRVPGGQETTIACFRTTCAKYNTAMNRAWKWCERSNKIVVDIHATRLPDELRYDLDAYCNELK